MIFSNSVLSTFSPPAAALAFSTSSDILQIAINDFFVGEINVPDDLLCLVAAAF